MAVKTQKIVEDTGSQEVEQLRVQLNLLLTMIDAAATFADLQTAVAASSRKIGTAPTLPAAPRQPVP